MTTFHIQRVADQIQHTLSELLRIKANDPRFQQTTITSVQLSPDMGNAKIYISVLDETHIKEILKALNKAQGFFRSELAHALNLRITPKLHFAYDDSISRGSHLSKLIDDALKK